MVINLRQKQNMEDLRACRSSDEPHGCNGIGEQIQMYEIKPICNFVEIMPIV